MYLIEVKINAYNSEYIIFENIEQIVDFMRGYILYIDDDYRNTYSNKRYNISGYIYILLDNYKDKINKHKFLYSNEFGAPFKIIQDNYILETYFKKVKLVYTTDGNVYFNSSSDGLNDSENDFDSSENDFDSSENNLNDSENDFDNSENDFDNSENDFDNSENNFDNSENDLNDSENNFNNSENENSNIKS